MRLKNGKSYAEVLKYVTNLNIKSNTSYRGDCPACGGNNTFSVAVSTQGLKWYCFRASCKLKGVSKGKIDLFAAEDFLEPEKPKTAEPVPLSEFVGWAINIKEFPHVMKYLDDNNCIEAYTFYPNSFFYDKLQDRVVFVQYDKLTTIKLAIGRNISDYSRPVSKWYKYVQLPGEYYNVNHCPTHLSQEPRDIFIVEDCASACSLARFGHTIALCGTSYNLYALMKALYKHKTKNVVICLDKDAQLISLKLQRDLKAAGDFNVSIKTLSEDAKALAYFDLKKELGYYG